MSGTKQSRYIFSWCIKNYSAYNQVMGNRIVSPSFTIENLPGSKWCLLLYPKNRNGENSIELYLNWEPCDEVINAVQVLFSLSIIDDNSAVFCGRVNRVSFNKESPTWGFDDYFDTGILDKLKNLRKDDVLKLECCIRTETDKKLNVIGSAACTTIGIEQSCVEWFVKIPSLSEFSDRIKYPFLDLYNLEITLNSKKDQIAILIHLNKVKCDESHHLMLNLSVYDDTGHKLGWKRDIHMCESVETWKFPDFITKEMLKIFETNSFWYEFKLKCEISVSKKEIVSNYIIERFEFKSSCCIDSTPKNRPTSAMLDDFRNLFQNKNYSDVTIRCKNSDFPTHKFVLRLRSPVFAAMFDQDMLENKTGIVEVSDSDEITIKSFLEYLYTDTVDEINYDIAKDLILTADKYQVPSLIDYCASFLKTEIGEDCVLEIIAIADMIGCESLKSYAVNFIMENSDYILTSTEWIEWIGGNIKLATFILSELSADISKSE